MDIKKVIGLVLLLTISVFGILLFNNGPKKENPLPVKIENKPIQVKKPLLTPQELVLSENWSERIDGYQGLQKIDLTENPELIQLVFQCIEKEDDLRCFSYIFWPLQFNKVNKKFDEATMNKLFEYLSNDRPEIWFNSATTIRNIIEWKDKEKFFEKKKSLKGIVKLRLQLADNFSIEFINELKNNGEDPYSFLISNITFKTFEKCNEVFRRACEGLANYGDRKAIPSLILSISELHKNGKTKGWLTPAYALKAINYILDTN